MFNKNLSKAVSTEKTRLYLTKVYYDKEAASYVASNGHIILIEKTTDIYDTNKFLSPLTGLEEDCDFTFPEWQRIIPVDGDTIIDFAACAIAGLIYTESTRIGTKTENRKKPVWKLSAKI